MANKVLSIKMDETDCRLLGKSLRGNKDFLSSAHIKKKDFDVKKVMEIVSTINKL